MRRGESGLAKHWQALVWEFQYRRAMGMCEDHRQVQQLPTFPKENRQITDKGYLS